MAETVDMVNHPQHYANHPRFTCECIEISRLMRFGAGNAFKYLWRFTQKNGLEDLAKTGWYLRDLQDYVLPNFISVGLTRVVYPTQEEHLRAQLLLEAHVYPHLDPSDPLDRAVGYLGMGSITGALEAYEIWSDQQQ